MKVGLIRVRSIDDETFLNAHGKIIERVFPTLNVVSRCIENQLKGIYDDLSERIALPKIVELGKAFLKEEVKAIIVDCASDPGVKKLRELTSIPVIGAGSATASLALSLGYRVGVLGITEKAPLIMRQILGDQLVSYIRPVNVQNTLDLLKDEGKRATLEAAKALKKKGADVIAPACTGYSTIGIASEFEQLLGLPIIDPIIASGFVTYYAVMHKKM